MSKVEGGGGGGIIEPHVTCLGVYLLGLNISNCFVYIRTSMSL